MVEGERSKEPMQNEASDCLSFSWIEDEDDNVGEKEEGVVGSHEGHTTQNIANDEEKSENEGDSGEDQEKASESEGEDEKSEEENENTSEESEGSMTIGNTVIVPSEEARGEKRTEETGPMLTPFTRDEEESRGAKKPRKQVSVVEPVVEMDGKNESESALP
uniref:Protein ENDO16-like n=1 Tax=Nicotiana tabacum TaxID=4097 RepID=A0A1S3XAK9_TOBAC|nr:PREDICTED: protein ENDO16-like [Nicotiana tabacum]